MFFPIFSLSSNAIHRLDKNKPNDWCDLFLALNTRNYLWFNWIQLDVNSCSRKMHSSTGSGTRFFCWLIVHSTLGQIQQQQQITRCKMSNSVVEKPAILKCVIIKITWMLENSNAAQLKTNGVVLKETENQSGLFFNNNNKKPQRLFHWRLNINSVTFQTFQKINKIEWIQRF